MSSFTVWLVLQKYLYLAVIQTKRNIFMTSGKMEIMKKTKSLKIIRLARTHGRKNLPPNKLLSTRAWHALVASAAVLLLVSAAGVNLSISTVPPSAYFAQLINLASAMFSPAPPLPADLKQNTASRSLLFIAGHDEEKPLVPQSIREFLKTYSLAKFENAFNDALRFRQFKRVAEEIYRASGYELIRFDHLPGFIREKHEVLTYPLGLGGQESHFLFWRPLVKMNGFYYTYKGHDIFFLQKKLTALNLYHQPIDGIVGPELLYAVVQFQKQMALPLTGYPDPITLFLICQLADRHEENQTDEFY
jgi:hypothetical protein